MFKKTIQKEVLKMVNNLMIFKLKEYFKTNYADIWDLIDIDSEIDKTLTYEENFNHLKQNFDLLFNDYEIKINEVKTYMELFNNSTDINAKRELISILNEVKTENKRLFNKLLTHLDIDINDYEYFIIDSLSIKKDIEPKQINSELRIKTALQIKVILKSLNQKLRVFRHNYNSIENDINISQNSLIENIYKVVNILKSKIRIKCFKCHGTAILKYTNGNPIKCGCNKGYFEIAKFQQSNNEYKFIFRNGLIIFEYDKFLNCHKVVTNTTHFKSLNYFVYRKSFKFWNGIKRMAWVENNKGHIKYNHAGFMKIEYRGMEKLNNTTQQKV